MSDVNMAKAAHRLGQWTMDHSVTVSLFCGWVQGWRCMLFDSREFKVCNLLVGIWWRKLLHVLSNKNVLTCSVSEISKKM